MARIVLNIEAEDADDLRRTLTALTTIDIELVATPIREEEPEQPTATATQDAEPGEREARFKRTKDEIARGLTIEQAKAERAAATSTQGSSSVSTPSEPASGDQTSSTNADPFASLPTSSDSPASLTTKDVRDAMGAFLNRDGKDAAQIKDVLHQFKQENGEVVNAASQLQATDYAAFIEKLAA